MTHGFPNQFFVGFFQGGFNASTTETFNNQGRHIAWIVSQALSRGARTVEPSRKRKTRTSTTSAKSPSTPPRSSENARPDISTMTGKKSRTKGELRPRTYTGETYGLGYYAFEKLLEDWRSNDDLSGLVVET